MLRFVANKDKPNDPTRWVSNGQHRTTPTFESANYLIRMKLVGNTLETPDWLTPAELAGIPLANG